MFNLGQICQNSEAKILKKPAYRHQPVLCSLIKHAISANQSARYMFGKVRLAFAKILENLRKVVGNLRKIVVIVVYIINRILHARLWKVEHPKIKFISTRGHVISFVYYINTSEIPSELSRENFISSHVKRSPSLWLP